VNLHTSADERRQAQPSSAVIASQSEGGPSATVASDYWILGALLSLISLLALWFFHSRNEILLSGDAVAHINIARRVFDSRTPGPLQLGSVWLPLPHLLTIPFVISSSMWRSGIGGSIVSLISYVVGALGLFRLLATWSRLAAWIGTAFFAANPNLLFVQTTALNEPLYLASFVWAVVFFAEASRTLSRGEDAGKSLEKGAVALTAAILTRYDGWFLACVCWILILPNAIRELSRDSGSTTLVLRKSVAKALLLTALGPALWFGYNLGVYGNALEFANGPYSAKAIAQRTTAKDAPPYPGEKHLWTAGVYFTKAAQLNIGEARIGKLVLVIATLAGIAFLKREWISVVLLWSPLVFYSLSVAFASVPIFIPVWWPFSYYNVRYGLELLPAMGGGIGICMWLGKNQQSIWTKLGRVCVILVVALAYVGAWRAVPICLREVRANGQARMELDRRIAVVLASLPAQSTVLAYTGSNSGAFELAAFPLRRAINEGNLFIWDVSMLSPALAADYVIATEGDQVSQAVAQHPAGLSVIATIEVKDQPRTVIYKSFVRLPKGRLGSDLLSMTSGNKGEMSGSVLRWKPLEHQL